MMCCWASANCAISVSAVQREQTGVLTASVVGAQVPWVCEKTKDMSWCFAVRQRTKRRREEGGAKVRLLSDLVYKGIPSVSSLFANCHHVMVGENFNRGDKQPPNPSTPRVISIHNHPLKTIKECNVSHREARHPLEARQAG